MIELREELHSMVLAAQASGTDWWAVVAAPHVDEPYALVALLAVTFGLAVSIGIAGRSVLLLLGAAIWAVVGLYLASGGASGTVPFFLAAIIVSQLFVLTGIILVGRQVRRLNETIRIVEDQKREVQVSLDREIIWRKAADHDRLPISE